MEVIDHVEHKEQSALRTSLKWWEKRRIWFNLLVGISGIVGIMCYAPFFGLIDMIFILTYGIIANLFYSIGFVLEALNLHYLEGKINLKANRILLFIIGTALSCILTFAACLQFYSAMLQ